MSSKKLFATLLTLVAIAGATFVYGQGPTPGMDGHIHDSHPTTSHGSGSGGGGWIRTSLESTPSSPVPVVNEDSRVMTEIYNLDVPNLNCSDYNQGGLKYTAMAVHTVHVTLAGSYTWAGSVEAGGNILAATRTHEVY